MLEPTGNYLMFKMVDYKRMDIETDLLYITKQLKNIQFLYAMVGFQTKTFMKHDNYMTPKYAWENIQQ